MGYGVLAHGQNGTDINTIDQYVETGVVYNTEWALEFRAHTHGFTVGYLTGKLKKYNKTTFRKIEFGLQRDSREHLQNTAPQSGLGGFNQYTYGKINYLLPLRISTGVKTYLSEKEKRRGLAVGFSYEGGFTLGLQVPYYLQLRRSIPDQQQDIIVEERFSEENADVFLDPTFIVGASGIGKGLSEMSFKPAVNGRFGAHFAWGAYDRRVMALELGVMADMYLTPVQLIAQQDNKHLYLNFYISLQMGLRS